MVRFVTCPTCGCAAKTTETECPACHAPLRSTDGTVPRHRTALLLGLTALAVPPATVTACGDDEDGRGGADATSAADTSSSMPYSGVSKYAAPGVISSTGANSNEDAESAGDEP